MEASQGDGRSHCQQDRGLTIQGLAKEQGSPRDGGQVQKRVNHNITVRRWVKDYDDEVQDHGNEAGPRWILSIIFEKS